MEFSSLVLMERDSNTNHLIKELGSYEVNEGANFVTKLFFDGHKVNLYFDTNKDVEEWEFTAIYDLFDEDMFVKNGIHIEPYDEEYNPTWIVKFDFVENHEEMKEKINKICSLIYESMDKVFEDICEKKQQYV